MEISKEKLTEENFMDHYKIIKRELKKIASGHLCEGIVIHTSIYSILICGGDAYAERLYWFIGDYFYAIGKEKKSTILNDSDWFQKYCECFLEYRKIVEVCNALCLFLNKTPINIKKGRMINDFGYLLWERCVIQPLECILKINFGQEMINRMERADKAFYSALLSLKLVVPDISNPLFFYELVYEEKALACIKKKYKNMQLSNTFDEYIMQCEEIYYLEHNRRGQIFLQESFPKLELALEETLISSREQFISANLYNSVKIDYLAISKYCPKLKNYSQKFANICKNVLRLYIKTVLTSDLSNINSNKTHEMFFNIFLAKVTMAEQMIQSCFPEQPNLADDLFITQCNAMKYPSYNLRLTYYVHVNMLDGFYEKCRQILKTGLRFCENKDDLASQSLKFLGRRCLTYNYDFGQEISILEIQKGTTGFVNYKKGLEMLDDVNNGIRFNCDVINYMKDTKNWSDYQNQVYFTSVLTFCSWPFREDPLYKDILLPNIFSRYVKIFEKKYIEKHPKRKLTWNWDQGFVDIVLKTDKEYLIRLNTYQYLILLKISEYNEINFDQLSALTNLKKAVVEAIVNTFLEIHMVRTNGNIVCLNPLFVYKKKDVMLDHVVYDPKIIQKHFFDLKSYYKAYIARICKKEMKIMTAKLCEAIKNNHIPDVPFDKEEFNKAMVELEDNTLIEIIDDLVVYDL